MRGNENPGHGCVGKQGVPQSRKSALCGTTTGVERLVLERADRAARDLVAVEREQLLDLGVRDEVRHVVHARQQAQRAQRHVPLGDVARDLLGADVERGPHEVQPLGHDVDVAHVGRAREGGQRRHALAVAVEQLGAERAPAAAVGLLDGLVVHGRLARDQVEPARRERDAVVVQERVEAAQRGPLAGHHRGRAVLVVAVEVHGHGPVRDLPDRGAVVGRARAPRRLPLLVGGRAAAAAAAAGRRGRDVVVLEVAVRAKQHDRHGQQRDQRRDKFGGREAALVGRGGAGAGVVQVGQIVGQ